MTLRFVFASCVLSLGAVGCVRSIAQTPTPAANPAAAVRPSQPPTPAPLTLIDPATDEVFRRPIPAYAFVRDARQERVGDAVRVTFQQDAARPRDATEPGIIEMWWTVRGSYRVLVVLEGGAVPHPRLAGKLTRDQAVFLDSRNIHKTLPVVRNGATVQVDVPADMLTGGEASYLVSRWLPYGVEKRFASGGVLGVSATSKELAGRYRQWAAPSLLSLWPNEEQVRSPAAAPKHHAPRQL